MKREIALHLGSFVILFLIISLLRGWFDLSFWQFWIGGLIGSLLPDIDHLIYVYYLRPHELTSQRVNSMMNKGQIAPSIDLLYTTRYERKNLIFHNAWFQGLFLILTFWVLSSSNSLLGRGIVLAFSLHLVLDQFIDLKQIGNIDHWFSQLKIKLDYQKSRTFCFVMLAIICILGFLF